MEIKIQLADEPIAEKIFPPSSGAAGAWVEFRGIVRGEENGVFISALEYEAYPVMVENEIRRLLDENSLEHPCLAAIVIHRLGLVPVGETAIYVGVAAKHRGPAFALLAAFMNALKQDVPIWKRRAIPTVLPGHPEPVALREASGPRPPLPLDAARAEISSRIQPLPALRIPLEAAGGRVLREDVLALEDSPACDRSTRDGYAILRADPAEVFTVVDTIHAADWKPRLLQAGEAVRVATGASLPCENLRVVMLEHVEQTRDRIKILRREIALNLRQQGEERRPGDTVLSAGNRLNAGALALLASVGCVYPLVSPRLRVLHLTTGDEIIPPGQTPKLGQIRDSNSILIRSLLEASGCKVKHALLPEDFALAKSQIGNPSGAIRNADLVLVSGGASVGDQDFTGPLLEWLGFQIVFSQVNVRPGKPLIFGLHGNRVAFGLPGNPLSHFVVFHCAVATALAKLTGKAAPQFLRGRLAAPIGDAACPRDTLWPAHLDLAGLSPLPWASSGDVSCFATANALIRVPPHCVSLPAGAEVDFLPAGAMLGS